MTEQWISDQPKWNEFTLAIMWLTLRFCKCTLWLDKIESKYVEVRFDSRTGAMLIWCGGDDVGTPREYLWLSK